MRFVLWKPVDFVTLERRPTFLLYPEFSKKIELFIHQKEFEMYHADEQARDGATTICSAGLELWGPISVIFMAQFSCRSFSPKIG